MSRRSHVATVLESHQITPRMRRLVFGGPEMAALRPAEGALGPYLKFRLPCPGAGCCVRTYSIRHFDPSRSELTVDIVVHGSDTVGSLFAAQARVGDNVEISGPGFIPAASCPDYILAGDQTALPAIANILETLPATARVQAFVEVPDGSEEQHLPSRADVRLSWLHRPDGEPSRLAGTICAAWPPPETEILVWAGAEAAIARAIRQHARTGCRIPASRCQVLNYWKAGEPEGGFSYIA